jgi:hypothetical protein
MLLMLKVATFTKPLSALVLSGVPKTNKRVRCSGPHYCTGVKNENAYTKANLVQQRNRDRVHERQLKV